MIKRDPFFKNSQPQTYLLQIARASRITILLFTTVDDSTHDWFYVVLFHIEIRMGIECQMQHMDESSLTGPDL